jgi:hypothetical protein
MTQSSKIQSTSLKLGMNKLKKMKIQKKDTWRFKGCNAGSLGIDIEPLI